MDLALVIFDMDGVIVDSEPLHTRVRRALLKSLSGGRADSLGYDPTGTGTAAYYGKFCKTYGAAETGEHAAFLHYTGVLKAIRAERPAPIEGVAETLEKLKTAGLRLAVASSSPRFFVEGILSHFGLEEMFEAVVCAEDVQSLKPAPDSYLRVLAQTGVPAEKAVAIEDSATGIRAALAAGVICAAYTGDADRPQDTTGTCLQLSNMGEFADAILKLAGADE